MILRRDEALAKKATLSLVECWDLSPTWLDGFAMEPEHDFHAGMIETSLIMYWKPELVQKEICMDDEYTSRMMRSDQDWFEKKEKIIDHPFIVEKVGQRDEIKVGVMGFPEKASRELGEQVCNEMVDNLVKYINMLEEHSK